LGLRCEFGPDLFMISNGNKSNRQEGVGTAGPK
jgi:hypothetical protein